MLMHPVRRPGLTHDVVSQIRVVGGHGFLLRRR
jgi:hypothetical protein